MSFHTGQSFTFGETPSATKWNYLWENDYALADGTGLEDDILDSRHYIDGSIDPVHHANRTRRVSMFMQADGSGGATASQNEGPEVQLTGTPTGYARGRITIPSDYVAGTDINLIVLVRSPSTNSGETTTHYIGLRAPGEAFSSWNIASGVAGSVSITADVLTEEVYATVAGPRVAAGDQLSTAWRISSALTGNVYVVDMLLEYTSNS